MISRVSRVRTTCTSARWCGSYCGDLVLSGIGTEPSGLKKYGLGYFVWFVHCSLCTPFLYRLDIVLKSFFFCFLFYFSISDVFFFVFILLISGTQITPLGRRVQSAQNVDPDPRLAHLLF